MTRRRLPFAYPIAHRRRGRLRRLGGLPPNVPEPQAPELSPLQRLAERFREQPLEMASRVLGVLAVLGGGVWMLGAWSQRIRESYLLLPALQYPAKVPLINGVEAIGGLFLNGLAAPLSDVANIKNCAFVAILLAPVAFYGAPALERHWRFSGVVLLAVLWWTLFFGLRFYDIAIFPFEPPGDGRVPGNCGYPPGADAVKGRLADIVIETCSWLENPGGDNALHRQELAGLLLWLLTLSAAAAGAAVRLPRGGTPSIWTRRALIVANAVLVALFLRLLPAVHAYESFGLTYPEVQLVGGEECKTPLRSAKCCIYDITGDATAVHLLLRGSGCPDTGVYPWAKSPEEKTCGRVLSERRPVVQGCG